MLLHWIWFAQVKNVSLLQKHRLLEQLGDPETIYHTRRENPDIPDNIRQVLQETSLQEAETILRRCMDKNIGILPVADEKYPEKLRNTPDAPIVLYYKGILPDWDAAPFVGVVGTRKASAYGLQVAHQMGSQIASCGGMIISGGASGADTAAMQGSLNAGVPVVGVLGSGVDVVYPRGNRRLFEAVTEGGCLISEYPPGDAPLAWHFPARNRIISGISSGVLVVEAPKISGALITARYALEQGRDVFVVPGNINNPACEGSNLLLQEGAMPVFSGWDVLSGYEFLYPDKLKKQQTVPLYAEERPSLKVAETVLTPMGKSEVRETAGKNAIDNRQISTYSVVENVHAALSDAEQAVLAQLTYQPVESSELMAKLDLSTGKVLSALTMLTVKGLACKYPGGRFGLK